METQQTEYAEVRVRMGFKVILPLWGKRYKETHKRKYPLIAPPKKTNQPNKKPTTQKQQHNNNKLWEIGTKNVET